MKVAILVEDMYEDVEFWYPYYRMKEAGAEVVVVAPKAGATYNSKHEYPAVSQLSGAEASADEFDAVIIPGGFCPDRLRRDPNILRFVADMDKKGKVVAAICHAGWVLISAKVLKGRKATSVSAIRDDMENGGCTWLNEPVVVDGNLITSRVPDDLPHFLPTIIKALKLA
ncbi:MAG: type 1 glutamine amidotransferase domain-containing protein [Anaerolineae bacterium]